VLVDKVKSLSLKISGGPHVERPSMNYLTAVKYKCVGDTGYCLVAMATHTRKQIDVILTITIYFGAKRQPVLFITLYITNIKNGTKALFVLSIHCTNTQF